MKNSISEISRQGTNQPRGLYRVAQLLSILMLLLIPLQLVLFVTSPPPDTVEGFFLLFQRSWSLGLMSLDFLYLLNSVILIFVYLSLFFRLYREAPSLSASALGLGLVGIACYFPSNPAFEMLTLSQKYAGATADVQNQLLAAGEALMAGYTGTAFVVYYVLNAVALILYAWAMLKNPHFKKNIGIFGMASGIFMIVPSSAGKVGMIFSLVSLLPWIVFLILLVDDYRRLLTCIPPQSGENKKY